MALYDHLADLKWLLVQHLGKLAPKAILEILATGMNLAEEAIDFIRTKLNVLDATGVYLDQIGAKYGVARQGLQDDEYRTVIIAEAASLFGSGTPAIVYKLLRQLLGPDPDITLVEVKFHTFLAYIGGNVDVPTATTKLLGQVLDDVPALTINGAIIAIDTECLNYSSVDGDVDVSAGFTSVDGTVAGAGFAHVQPL